MSETNVSLGPSGGEPTEVDREQLQAAMDAIRPALQADGGDIELVRVDDRGRVFVNLVGACGTCPISTGTLKGGVERILKDRVPGVTEVVDVSAGSPVLG